MKNFNRCDSYGHHSSKCRELAQHVHSYGSHAFTHTQYIQYNTIQYNFIVPVGKFVRQQKNITNIKTSQHCILYSVTKN